ncbi:MAG: MBOAT family protein, partial [Oscillospiraceae bacterium]|nr:MBOAT family protein [Oscillospiraceae bacterium]
MLFSSVPFLFYFLPAVLICYALAPKKFKNAVLVLFSLVFYAWGEPVYLILMLTSIGLGYLFGILMENDAKRKRLY